MLKISQPLCVFKKKDFIYTEQISNFTVCSPTLSSGADGKKIKLLISDIITWETLMVVALAYINLVITIWVTAILFKLTHMLSVNHLQ